MGIITAPETEDDLLSEEVEQALATGQTKKIETMGDAIRYAYGLSETNKEVEEVNRLADAEISKWQEKINAVNAWRESVVTPLQNKADYMSSLLLGFHVSEYYSAPNEKAQKKLNSIKLPYGVTLKSTQPQVSFEVKDELAYKGFMIANGYVEAQEPKLKWGEFKKTLQHDDNGNVVTEGGEVVDFLKVLQQDRKFEVK